MLFSGRTTPRRSTCSVCRRSAATSQPRGPSPRCITAAWGFRRIMTRPPAGTGWRSTVATSSVISVASLGNIEAVERARADAERGDAEAMHYLGLMHAFGIGAHRDPLLARMWFLLAAKHGCDKGLSMLANDPEPDRTEELAAAWRPKLDSLKQRPNLRARWGDAGRVALPVRDVQVSSGRARRLGPLRPRTPHLKRRSGSRLPSMGQQPYRKISEPTADTSSKYRAGSWQAVSAMGLHCSPRRWHRPTIREPEAAE